MYRLPTAVLWILVFAAVLGHFPGLGFDYTGLDFLHLAAGAGLQEGPGPAARPWAGPVVWGLWWRIGGADPSIPHGAALLLVAANALLIASIATRIGMPRAGAVLAAALWLLGPNTGVAVGWTTAGADLWALLFALAALRLWLSANSRRDPPLAGLLVLASLASGAIALAMAPLLALATRCFGPPGETATVRKGRTVLVGLSAIAGVASWWMLHADPAVRLAALRLPALDTGLVDRALFQIGSAAWLWPATPPASAARLVGIAVLVVVGIALFMIRAEPAPRLRFAFAWAGACLAGALFLPRLELMSGAMGISVGLAWAAGAWLGPRVEAVLASVRTRVPPAGAIALVLLLLIVGPGWGILRTAGLAARTEDGRLAHPALREAAISGAFRGQLAALMLGPAPPPAVALLQAVRVPDPEAVVVPEGGEVLFTTPAYSALAGNVGPRLILQELATAKWTTLLDEVHGDAFVFLDAGDSRLRPLGPVENARVYAALIAVAGGQFDLARHELWSVIEFQGARVSFVFDPDHLPITPAELDAQAANFVRWLQAKDEPADMRVLKFFASLYESVRGEALIQEGWGEPLRSGRIDR